MAGSLCKLYLEELIKRADKTTGKIYREKELLDKGYQ